MENLIRRGQTMAELHGSLTLMVQAVAADWREFAEAEMAAGKIVKEAYEFAGTDPATTEARTVAMIQLFDQIKDGIHGVKVQLVKARAMVREAADAVAESEARRSESRRQVML
jgi:hypothetical protein